MYVLVCIGVHFAISLGCLIHLPHIHMDVIVVVPHIQS